MIFNGYCSRNCVARSRSRLPKLLVAVASLFAVDVSVTPASAGTCGTRYCGGVVTNNSSGYVFVSNNWCWSNQSRYWGNTLPCAPNWNAFAPSSYFLLAPTDTTVNYYSYYDTDAFRVDAGCRMTTWDGGYVIYDNRGSSSPMWVKINNLQRISITVACW